MSVKYVTIYNNDKRYEDLIQYVVGQYDSEEDANAAGAAAVAEEGVMGGFYWVETHEITAYLPSEEN